MLEKRFITRDECFQYVVTEMTNGDPLIWALIEAVASKQEWITFATFDEVAEIIYKNINDGEKGIF